MAREHNNLFMEGNKHQRTTNATQHLKKRAKPAGKTAAQTTHLQACAEEGEKLAHIQIQLCLAVLAGPLVWHGHRIFQTHCSG